MEEHNVNLDFFQAGVDRRFIYTQRSQLAKERLIVRLVIGWLLLAVFAAIFLLHNFELNRHRKNSVAERKVLSTAVQKRLQSYSDILNVFRGLFSASSNVTSEEFKTFFKVTAIHENYPGLEGIRYVVRTEVPDSTEDQYLVKYAAPDEDQKMVVNFDVLKDPVRKAAYEWARDGAELTVSNATPLLGDMAFLDGSSSLKSAAYVMVLPLYLSDSSSIQQRRDNLAGFISAVFRQSDLLDKLSADFQTPTDVVMTGLDIVDDAEAPVRNWHDSLSEEASDLSEQFKFGGRTWRLKFRSQTESNVGSLTMCGSIVGMVFFLTVSSLIVRAHKSHKKLLECYEKADSGLLRTYRLMEKVIDHIPVPLFVKESKDLSIIFWNRAVESMTGIRREEVLGKTGYESFKREELKGYLEIDQRVLKEMRLIEVEEPITTPTNERKILHTKKVPLTGDNPQDVYLLGITEDVTERNRKTAEEALNKKLQSIGILASGIAHELHTPLQYLLLNLEYLRDRITSGEPDEDPSRLTDAIDQSLDGTYQAISIVKAMREYGGGQRGSMETCSLSNIIQSALIITKHQWKHNSEILISVDPPDLSVDCLRSELIQSLINIIVNATDAVEESKAESKGTINIDARRLGNEVQIRISDNGPGMSEDVLSRVFDPFFTTKEVGRGTGQGLSICRDIIVNKHQGKIDVRSEIGVGTTVSIIIPVHNILCKEVSNECEMHIC